MTDDSHNRKRFVSSDCGAYSLRFDPPLVGVSFWCVTGSLVDAPTPSAGAPPSIDGVASQTLGESISHGPDVVRWVPVVLTGWRAAPNDLRPQIFLPSDHTLRPLAPVTIIGCAGVTLIPLEAGDAETLRNASFLVEKGRRARP